MKLLGKTIVQILGFLFSILVLSFTGYQTWSLLLEVTGNPLIAALGLVLFEGGMLYWLATFKNDAEGIMQMAISLLLFIFGLFLVGGATALHLGAVTADTLGPSTPSKLITVAAILNLLGKTIYPIFAPETFAHVYKRALEGLVMAKAYAAAQDKTDDLAIKLADTIGDEMVRKLTVSVLTSQHLAHNVAKALPHTATPIITAYDEGEVIEGEVTRPQTQPQANEYPGIWQSFINWVTTGNRRYDVETADVPAPPRPQSPPRQPIQTEPLDTPNPQPKPDQPKPPSDRQAFQNLMAEEKGEQAAPYKVILSDNNQNKKAVYCQTLDELSQVIKGNRHLRREVYRFDPQLEYFTHERTFSAELQEPIAQPGPQPTEAEPRPTNGLEK